MYLKESCRSPPKRFRTKQVVAMSMTAAGVGATPPFGAQRQSKDHNVVPATASIGQEVLLQLMKLKDDLLAAGKEHYVQAKKYLIKAVEEVDDVFEFEKEENERISEAFKEAGIDVTISYMLWREEDASSVNRNSSIHIDCEGDIRGTASQPVFPAMKELAIHPYPNPLIEVYVYISNHFILMLEKEEASTSGETEMFHVETRHLDGVRQPDSTILNPNAWFFKEREPGQETFAIRSAVHDACIQAGTEVALKAVESSMCDRNLQSITIHWQP